jgi:hypothetical protein
MLLLFVVTSTAITACRHCCLPLPLPLMLMLMLLLLG